MLADSLLPVGRQHSLALVVACQSVHAALHQDEPELGVLVLALLFQVLPNSHRLLDQVVEVFRQTRSQPCTHTQH